MTTKYLERFEKIEKVVLIDNKKIDLDYLREGSSYGCPEKLRPIVWRLLLNFLPLERQKWKSFTTVFQERRNNYNVLLQQFIVDPGQADEISDHPLSENPHSDWNAFFEDNKILGQIDKDVRRLHPEIQLFQMPTNFPNGHGLKYPLYKRITGDDAGCEELFSNRDGGISLVNKSKRPIAAQPSTSESHWQVVERILFIYAKLNPGVQYVQGMNELIAPIYYVFASDKDVEWAEYAEADTFFCFQQLMSEVKDNFIKTLDSSMCGIESLMSLFHSLLASFDPELYHHLIETLNIKPQFYAFRWLSLMLSQEFPLPDVITLWDSLFADSKRFSLLPFICLAMLEIQRNELLNSDFAECMRLLQNYPEMDVANLVVLGIDLRDGRATRPSQELTKRDRIVKHARQLSDTIKNISSLIKK